ncbi:unnamed protein product [Bursaphelenchus okinawaensis]|uniref:Anaphase-promoting complex subunit 4 WD40 domain-containing protein n=1 Tax=Bursaphelenchus okinawaensis TaxID=465554 RepID=A0A811LN46_9BILA|nr:unnamed protein product [Bursaphelenchus okinawaensis]CAG9125741.1 unnamed protein product [Bursaphelenchus okinawaensis]
MQHTYIFLTKKVAVSGAKELSSVAWMKNRGFIAVGADEGVVKVLQLPGENEKSIKNPFKKFMHLEGHSSGARVIYASWNEVYQKLATCDEGGLIVVWIMHPNEEGWFEEMVNNRQKSSVVAVKWSHDGTVDGNRIWSKDLTSHLAQLCWHGSDALVLVGLSDGDVHGYDMNGNFAFKVTMMCVETVELRTALEKDLKKDVIIFMDWFVPTPVCKADPLQPNEEMLRLIRHNAVPPEPIVFRGEIAPDQPRFVVAYQHGILQMMRSELDTSPIICRLPNTVIIQCAWSPDGSILAVAGYQTDLSDEEKNLVHFLTPFGVKIQTMKLTAGKLSGITWEGSGLRLVVTIDAFIYLAIVKPAYKWAFCGKTLVYTYKNIDVGQEMIMFYETKMDDTFKRQTADVWQLLACGDYCVVVSQVNEVGGIYKIEVCDSIGTPVDSTQTNVQPFSISVAPGIVVMASSDKFLVWYYHVPRTMTVDHRAPQKPAEPQVYHIDDYKSSRNQESGSAKKGNRTVFDGICCVCTGKDMILVGRESGTVHRYNLPDVTLVQKYQLSYSAETMALNSTNTRLALINKHHLLKFFDIKDNNAVVVPNFERKDVWGVIWDKNREDTLVCMEKQKVLVIHGTETEDPVNNTGYLCDFTDLMVKCAQLDEVLRDPESPTKSAIVSIETKTLRQAKELLDQDKIPEATKFIEGHSHPKLWNLLATFALNKLDLKTAEHAFVELQDFGGLQFLKKLKNIKSEALKKAEVCTFLGDLDVAEHICFENDRRDLAIDMRTKMNDWFRVLQILQTSTGPGDDIMLQRAWKHVGDFFMDRQKWQSAAKHYESGQHFKELVKCYVMMDDYARLETLAQQLPDGHEVLKDLADIFTNSGLCNQAVECYLRLDMINEALDTCIRLNQWDKAVELSEKYKLSNAINLLNNYAEELTGSIEKTLAAAQLYRKAAMSLEATKIIFNIAKDQMGRQCPPLRAKKLFVMGGLLIEQHREHSKSKITKNGQETSTAAIKGLLEEEHTLSIEDSRLIDTAWRGAEAMHFYMLCQQQLHQHKFDAAMKTALVLTEYEEVIPSLEIYTLLALASCQAKQFSVCSKAFMKIESMDNIPEDELEQYNALSLKIFLKYPPKDTKPTRTECHTCGTMVMDYATSCTNPTCGVKFPICIASGRPIHDYQFWLCPQCKHRAYEQEIQFSRHCPLCHCAV